MAVPLVSGSEEFASSCSLRALFLFARTVARVRSREHTGGVTQRERIALLVHGRGEKERKQNLKIRARRDIFLKLCSAASPSRGLLHNTKVEEASWRGIEECQGPAL